MTPTDPKFIFGAVAAAVNLAGFFPYVRDVLRGSTKPHPFTWFIWGVIGSIGFFAQHAGGGGTGAWTTLAGSLGCFLVAVLSITHGELRISPLDWLCLGGALLGLALWGFTNNPLLATILVTLSDALGFVPTFRKAYLRPHEETAFIYATATISFVLGMLALQTYSLTTLLYPAYIATSAAALFALLMVRRRQLG